MGPCCEFRAALSLDAASSFAIRLVQDLASRSHPLPGRDCRAQHVLLQRRNRVTGGAVLAPRSCQARTARTPSAPLRRQSAPAQSTPAPRGTSPPHRPHLPESPARRRDASTLIAPPLALAAFAAPQAAPQTAPAALAPPRRSAPVAKAPASLRPAARTPPPRRSSDSPRLLCPWPFRWRVAPSASAAVPSAAHIRSSSADIAGSRDAAPHSAVSPFRLALSSGRRAAPKSSCAAPEPFHPPATSAPCRAENPPPRPSARRSPGRPRPDRPTCSPGKPQALPRSRRAVASAAPSPEAAPEPCPHKSAAASRSESADFPTRLLPLVSAIMRAPGPWPRHPAPTPPAPPGPSWL